MKKIIKLSYFLFVSLALVSCSSDDNDDQDIFTNSIEYLSNVVDVEEATIYDYGSDDGYYAYEFDLVGTLADDSEVNFYAQFVSEEAESITTGTFQYYEYDYHNETEVPNNYFGWSRLYIDESSIGVVGGTIIVSKNSGTNSYSISGVLTLENEETLTISYSGEFTYYDDSQTKVSASPKSSRFLTSIK